MNRLDVRLFGRFAVACEGRTLGPRDFGGIKPKQIFEILVLARGHAVPKDRLADLLWGELLPQNVSGSLGTYVSVLRSHLFPKGRHGHELIVTEPEAYRLAADRVDVDVDRFDALLAHAGDARGAATRQSLEAAIALARGDVLEDEPYAEWVLPVRELYQERLLQALADAAAAALVESDYDAALAHARAATQLDSVHEAAYRTMMLAYHALDRPQDALRTYERCRDELERVLDATPSPATEAVQAGVRGHEHAFAVVGGSVTRTREAVADARQNGAVRPGRLIGRRDELNAIDDAIAHALDGTFGLVVVEGQPGIGKTRVLDDALSGLPAGVRVGRARCSELERSVPYTALASALREAFDGVTIDPACARALSPILPELALQWAPTADDPRALEALVSVVRSIGSLVLVLDDLHHADPATITALGYLSRRCHDLPLAVLAAVRPEEIGPHVPAYALEPTFTLRLGPLGRRELVAAGLGALYERTGGHPLLVSALAAGDGTLPQPTVELLIERCRVDGLFAFRVLATAAVLEQPFSPDVLTQVLDAPEQRVAEALERHCERGVIEAVDERFAFRFPILAEVLDENLTPFGRSVLVQRARAVAAQAAAAL